MRDRKYIIINRKAEDLLRKGHIWVYGEEILQTCPGIENGDIIDVYSQKERYLGSGFYNSASKITVRLLSANANDVFDAAFFARRVKYAVDYRAAVMNGDLSNTRLVFGDADGFPGLIADKFGSVLVTQTMTLGLEQRKDLIFPALINHLRERGENITCLYERNDVSVRKKEGLELNTQYYAYDGLSNRLTETEITENGIRYKVDFIGGQKTGFFLDQKLNRRAAAAIAPGKTVLDCFTHTGAFALNCALGGAKSVTAVDISQDAINRAKENAALNGVDNMDFLCTDVFDLLDKLYAEKRRIYDYIILDPPAFTKSTKTVNAAYNGYKEINLKAMRILPRGGWLATCSCSHFMTDALFRKMLLEAALEAGVQLKIAEYRQQAPDHPVLLGVPETEYLKFYIAQAV
ncbi:MAG: class I SAM-dependent rRNA methyltransferase [Clostridia bacterium]|nr:class I SAM-dependent rRNA methyltransferase [Clostridia bacterium]